jgi:putative nucleotidyltransferase with HDIG domain
VIVVLTFFGLNLLVVGMYLALQSGVSFVRTLYAVIAGSGGNLAYDLLASPIAVAIAVLYGEYSLPGLLVIPLPLFLIRYSYLSKIQLHQALGDVLRVLVKAIETRDPYTSGHSLRVSQLARAIGEDMGFRGRALERIEQAALLHDIGKIDEIYAVLIRKTVGLSEDERQVIRTHATRGAELLETLGSIDPAVVAAVRHHHEHFDGSGYPDGLKGTQAPLAARIIMLCDSIDAMLSDRPYRKALSIEHVQAELIRCSGTQFDPEIVEVILQRNTLDRAASLVGERVPQPKQVLAHAG